MSILINGDSLSYSRGTTNTLCEFFKDLPTKKSVKKSIIDFKTKNDSRKDNYIDKKYEKEFDKLQNVFINFNNSPPEHNKNIKQNISLKNGPPNVNKLKSNWDYVQSKKDILFKYKDDEDKLINKQLHKSSSVSATELSFYPTVKPKNKSIKHSCSSQLISNKQDKTFTNFKKNDNDKQNELNDSYVKIPFNPVELYPSNKQRSLYNLISRSEAKKLDNFESKKSQTMFSNLLDKKKKFYHNNQMTYFLNKTFFKDKKIPILLPNFLTYNVEYASDSEKERNEKNTKALTKLKFFLDNCPTITRKIIREFFSVNKIYDQSFYSAECVNNFRNFILESHEQIDCRKNIIDIIKEGVKYQSHKVEASFSVNTKHIKNEINNEKQIKVIKSTKSTGVTDIKKINKEKTKTEIIEEKSFNSPNNKPFLYKSNSSSLIFDMNEQTRTLNKFKNINPINLAKLSQSDVVRLERQFSDLFKIKINKNNPYEAIIQRLYYEEKQKKHNNNFENVAKRSHKLLEFIVLQKALNKQAMLQDLLQNYEANNEQK